MLNARAWRRDCVCTSLLTLSVRLHQGYTLPDLQLPDLGPAHDYSVNIDDRDHLYKKPVYTIAPPTEPSSHSSSVQAHPTVNYQAFQYPDYRQGYRVVVARGAGNGVHRRMYDGLGPAVPSHELDRDREMDPHQLAQLKGLARSNGVAGEQARARLAELGQWPAYAKPSKKRVHKAVRDMPGAAPRRLGPGVPEPPVPSALYTSATIPTEGMASGVYHAPAPVPAPRGPPAYTPSAAPVRSKDAARVNAPLPAAPVPAPAPAPAPASAPAVAAPAPAQAHQAALAAAPAVPMKDVATAPVKAKTGQRTVPVAAPVAVRNAVPVASRTANDAGLVPVAAPVDDLATATDRMRLQQDATLQAQLGAHGRKSKAKKPKTKTKTNTKKSGMGFGARAWHAFGSSKESKNTAVSLLLVPLYSTSLIGNNATTSRLTQPKRRGLLSWRKGDAVQVLGADAKGEPIVEMTSGSKGDHSPGVPTVLQNEGMPVVPAEAAQPAQPAAVTADVPAVVVAPAQPPPVTSQPVSMQAMSTQTIPTQTMPMQTMPTQSMPTQSMPTQSMPTQSMPTQPMPTQPVSSQPVSSQPVSLQAMPTQPIPTQPTQAMPTQPIPTQPTQAMSTQAMPTQTTPTTAPRPTATAVPIASTHDTTPTQRSRTGLAHTPLANVPDPMRPRLPVQSETPRSVAMAPTPLARAKPTVEEEYEDGVLRAKHASHDRSGVLERVPGAGVLHPDSTTADGSAVLDPVPGAGLLQRHGSTKSSRRHGRDALRSSHPVDDVHPATEFHSTRSDEASSALHKLFHTSLTGEEEGAPLSRHGSLVSRKGSRRRAPESQAPVAVMPQPTGTMYMEQLPDQVVGTSMVASPAYAPATTRSSQAPTLAPPLPVSTLRAPMVAPPSPARAVAPATQPAPVTPVAPDTPDTPTPTASAEPSVPVTSQPTASSLAPALSYTSTIATSAPRARPVSMSAAPSYTSSHGALPSALGDTRLPWEQGVPSSMSTQALPPPSHHYTRMTTSTSFPSVPTAAIASQATEPAATSRTAATPLMPSSPPHTAAMPTVSATSPKIPAPVEQTSSADVFTQEVVEALDAEMPHDHDAHAHMHLSRADRRYLEVQRELAAERARQDRAERHRQERLAQRAAARQEAQSSDLSQQWAAFDEQRQREREAGLPPPSIP